MIKRTAILWVALSLPAQADGPSLGRVTNVVITARHVTSGQECVGFKPTARDVAKFLNAAMIITGEERHHGFSWSDCRVEGTARVGGRNATWTMRALGTGEMTIYGAYSYILADEKQRERSDIQP